MKRRRPLVEKETHQKVTSTLFTSDDDPTSPEVKRKPNAPPPKPASKKVGQKFQKEV